MSDPLDPYYDALGVPRGPRPWPIRPRSSGTRRDPKDWLRPLPAEPRRPDSPRHPRGVHEYPAPPGWRYVASTDSSGELFQLFMTREDAYDAERVESAMHRALDRHDPPPIRLAE